MLVGGWPGSGKTTLAVALSAELRIACLSKDDVKEALMDVLGAPATVQRARLLGRAAVVAVLRAARGCPAAVVDSTWFDYTRPLVEALPGPVVEVRCVLDVEIARRRFRSRGRDPRHLDYLRDEAELWATPVPPLGAGPLVEVDTGRPVDVPALATRVRALLDAPPAG